MIRTLLSTVLLASSLFATQGDANELTFATYDIAHLVPNGADQHRAMHLLPLVLSDDGRSESDIGGLDDSSDYSFVEHLLVDRIAPDLFEASPLAMVHMVDDDRLLVRATDDVHQRFTALLDHLRAATHRTATLTIETYRATGTITADIEALANNARSGHAVLVGSQRRTVEIGNSEVFNSVQSIDILRTWEVEIAQSAAIADPVYENLSIGSEWHVRVEHPVGQKLRVRFAHRHSEIAAWETRDLGMESVVMIEGRPSFVPSIGVIDRPLISTAANWGEVAIPASGGAAWIASQAASSSGPVSYISRISVSDVTPAPAPTKLNATTDAWVMDASHLVWLGYPSRMPVARDWRRTDGGDGFEEAAARNVLEFPSSDFGTYDNVMSSVYDLPQARTEPIDIVLMGSWFLVVAPQSVLADAAGLSKVYGRPTRSTAVDVVVSRRVRATGVGMGEVIGHARLNVDARSRAGTIVGQQQPVITDYDVEVANSSAVAEPTVDSIFSGLAVEVRSANADSVALDVLLHLRRDASEMQLEAELIGVADRIATFVGDVSVNVPVDGERHTWAEFAVEGDTIYDVQVRATSQR